MLTLYLILAAAVSFVSAAQFSNPIRRLQPKAGDEWFADPLNETYSKSGPDPFIVWDSDTSEYYLMTTTGDDLRIISANTLGGLYDGDDQQVFTNAAMQNGSTVWAGELHKIDGTWYIYYAHDTLVWALEGGSSPLDAYAGPPVQLFDNWGIDPTVLVHSGTNYLLWACHAYQVSNSTAIGSSLCISELTSPTTIDQSSITVISSATKSWEEAGGHVNEAPQPIYWDGEIYLTFSASSCTTANYSLGLLHLTGDDPMDASSWVKKTDGPVFSSGNGEYGPGHNGIFLSPDGTELWNVYHAVTNMNGSCGMDRQTFAQVVDTSEFATGGPNFDSPVAKGKTLDSPSGENSTTTNSTTVYNCTASASIPGSNSLMSSAVSSTLVSSATSSEIATSSPSMASLSTSTKASSTSGKSTTATTGEALVATEISSVGGSATTSTSTTVYVTWSMTSDEGSSSGSESSATASVTGGGLSCKAKRAKLGEAGA